MQYEEFRKQLTHKVEERPEWKELATFVPNKPLPVYNWFYYKEGFAKQLVEKLIEMFGLKEGDMVLDPFCGSGTTLVACKQAGINSAGTDVLPTAVFAASVKAANYNPEKLREEAKVLFRRKFRKLEWEFPKIMRAMINKYALDDIAFFLEEIKKIEQPDFFLLALMNASIKVSYAYKDGAVIKIRKRHVAPLRYMLQFRLGCSSARFWWSTTCATSKQTAPQASAPRQCGWASAARWRPRSAARSISATLRSASRRMASRWKSLLSRSSVSTCCGVRASSVL